VTPIPSAAVVAVAASAALLFGIEPFVGKVLLPALGGTPAVWNTCVMVFQALLLAGYMYSTWLVRIADVRRAVVRHTILVAASCVIWPLTVRALWLTPRPGWPPVAWVVAVTTAAIGLPFAILSATSPLLQVWLARTSRVELNVHRLYAASNVASAFGLLLYVAVLEPLAGVRQQNRLLWVAYGGAMALSLIVAWRAGRAPDRSLLARARAANGEPRITNHERRTTNDERRTTTADRSAWVGLSFGASMTLYAVNTYIATDIASFPLLWCIPLAVFLMAFAAGFSAWAERHRLLLRRVARLTALATLAFLVWFVGLTTVWVDLAVPLAALAVLVTALAAELAHRRPQEEHLAAYYMLVGLGGVLAGVMNVVILPWAWSPVLLEGVPGLSALVGLLRALSSIVLTHPVPEYAAVLLLAIWLLSSKRALLLVRTVLAASLTVAIAPVAIRMLAAPALTAPQRWGIALGALATAFVVSLPGHRLLAASLALALVGGIARPADFRTLFESRNFFGTSRVQLDRANNVLRLKHGTTLHGLQPVGPAAGQPASYYGLSSPIGQTMKRLRPRQVLVLGLGVGTLAAYGRSGDRYRFLEINPLVVGLVDAPRWFSYLEAARQRGVAIQITLGDGRITARGVADHMADLIVVDAFSSDSVPVHLLTAEALQEFARKLAVGGVIAFNVSNRFFDLPPVIAAAADRAGFTWAVQSQEATTEYEAASTWVLVAPSVAGAARAGMTEAPWTRPAFSSLRATAPWTDDWANVLGALRAWHRISEAAVE
jgi:spermidine synthase